MKKADGIVAEIQVLLGEPVVLLHWPKGSKGGNRKWGYLRPQDMTSAYLGRLHRGNIGVALGEVSGGLCAIDLDDDTLVGPFLLANPRLRETLQTHGSRGRVFWVRLIGKYPNRTIKLKTKFGTEAGEFRSTGSQSIISGIHPDTKKPYEFVTKEPVVKLEFQSISWPPDISNPIELKQCTEEPESPEETEEPEWPDDTECPEETEEPEYPDETEWADEQMGQKVQMNRGDGGSRGTESTEETEDQKNRRTEELKSYSAERCALSYPTINCVEDALRLCVPTKKHQNNALLFNLARAVKSVEAKQGKNFAPLELESIFDEWYNRAKKCLRDGQTREDYLIEFMNACEKAKFPLDGMKVAKAWEKANLQPLPSEALRFENPKLRLLTAFLKQLQVMAGTEPFFITMRDCAALLQIESHSTVDVMLGALRKMGYIRVAKAGNEHRATRYLYVWSAQE